MIAVYAETSAILSWLQKEKQSGAVQAAVDDAGVVVTSSLAFAEVDRALARAESSRLLGTADAQRLRGLVHRARSNWMTMAITEDVLALVGKPFPVEPLRTLDAIHLATALTFLKALPDLTMLSFDLRIRANADALGIPTVASPR